MPVLALPRLATHFFATLVALVAACVPAAAQRPTLVVLVTVDQLLPDYMTRWQGQLTGGLRRLHEGGAVFTRAHQDHAITETAPGHASTLSGRFPRSTGIVTNVAGVHDPRSPLLGSTGPGASPFRFRGSTLTDWLRATDPRSRALSVSRKDRGAILPVGRARQAVFWYGGDGRFTTSRYYADTLPAWVRRFNEARPVLGLAGHEWRPLLPDSAYPEPDSVPAENGGRGYTFPHRIPTDSVGAAREAASTPFIDEVTLRLALAGVREMGLGAGPATDVLAVSLSATDAVGHRYGPDSREVHDQVLRVDRMLGDFLDSIFALRGRDHVVVALTADHGVTPYPHIRHPHDFDAYYVRSGVFTGWLAQAARRAGVDSAALGLESGAVLYDSAAFARAGRDPAPILRAFVAFARAQPGVLRSELRATVDGDRTGDWLLRRWRHMLPPDLPVGAFVTLKPEHLWGTPSSGYTNHGSPHDADAAVPLVFYGAAFRPGRYPDLARTVDIAPTLAHVLGVRPTEPLDGRTLAEALRD